MLRVLQLPGTINLKDGRMNVIMNVYRHIDREKIQFDFLATDDGGDSFKSEIIKLGGRVYTIPRNKINNLPYLVKKLHNLVKDKHYTIIHYHATSQWVVALLGVKRLGVKKIIIHSHAPYYSDSFAKSIRNALISLPIFMEGTTFVAVSEEAGRGLFFRKSFQVIANSIDLKRFKYCERDRVYIRKKLGLGSTDIIIGNVGRFSKQKNQFFALDVFSRVKEKENKNWYLLLIGQGKLKKKLINRVKKLGIDKNVIILNTKKDIERYYSAMDSLLFPSIYEGFGMVALEAQANGLPVLISGAVPKIVNICGVTSLSLKNNSIENWSDKLIGITASTKERRSDAINLIGKRGFDSFSIAEKWENLYFQSN